MPAPWTITLSQFDGGKFAARYSLDAFRPDFWVVPTSATEGQLYLREGVTIPDDPPVIEAPDATTRSETRMRSPDGRVWTCWITNGGVWDSI